MKISHPLTLLFVLISGIAAVWFLNTGWTLVGSVEMTTHGWIALMLGMGVSILIGGGLTILLVWSRRNGFDEAAHEAAIDMEAGPEDGSSPG